MLEQENDLSLASGFEHSSKNKDFSENSAVDSGFLSGPQAIYSGELDSTLSEPSSDRLPSKEKHQLSQIDTFTDSGCIDDSTQLTSKDKRQQMHIDTNTDSGIMISGSGVGETGLPDWFNNLSIKDTANFNNLDATKEKSNQQKNNLWEQCYRQDNDGDTQLHLAIINEIPNIIWAIIRLAPAPWLLDLKNDDAQAPIHLAVLTGQSKVVRRLLIAGAKASIRDGDGNTALHLACKSNDMKSVEALLTPITDAELKEYNQIANQLPQSNASRQFSIDLEQRNFYGENCVHIAAQQNHTEILQLLIREGVDINAREGRAGYTPLHIAVENKNLELATFLIESSKYLNTEARNYRQITAYQLACELGHSEMIKTLQRLGCDVISPPDSDYEDSDESFEMDSDSE